MVNQGVAPVRVEVLEKLLPRKSNQKFSVQVGAFASRDNAEALKDELEKNYRTVYITRFTASRKTYYRVRIRARDREASSIIAGCLEKRGYRPIALEEE
jgi:cell division septation protein DedD